MDFLTAAREAYGKDDYKATLEYATKELALSPHSYASWVLRGAALLRLGNAYSAILNFDKAITIRNDVYDAWNNRGSAFFRLGLFDEACADFDHSLMLEPNQYMSHFQLGLLYSTTERLTEAEYHLRRADALGQGSEWNRALVNLQLATLLQGLGKWEEGFQRDQCRYTVTDQKFVAPRWTGEDLSGKHILVFTEGGWGDKILSLRYIDLLREKYPGARISVAAQRDITSLIKQSYPDLEVTNMTVSCDYMLSLLDIPMALKLTWSTVPRPQRYLSIAPDLVSKWKEKFKELPPGLNIGLCWASFNGVSKTILPHELEDLGGIQKVNYISLQKPYREISPRVKLYDWTNEIQDWSDTGAIIENLDLVISIDTGVAHLAGALGKPVWNIVRFSTYWPWMQALIPRSPDYCIWYPTMELFRLKKYNDWFGTVRRIVLELQRRIVG